MKVKELKKLLEEVDDNRIIILQKDGEGNGFSPLEGLDDEVAYRAECTWSGDIGYQKMTPELKTDSPLL